MNNLVGFILLFCVSTLVTANDTIEVFMTSKDPVKNIAAVKNKGIDVVTYWMDGVEKINARMAQKATKQLKPQIDALVQEIGLEKLVAMSEFKRNQLLLKQLEKSHINFQTIGKTLVSNADRNAIKLALEDLIYAEKNGITSDMLPAILYRGQLYKNIADLFVLIKQQENSK